MTTLDSPYGNVDADDGEWLRGNVHAHTTESDGELDVMEVVEAYAERDYDFIAITDHDQLLMSAPVSNGSSLTVIGGVEVSELGPHVVVLGAGRPIAPAADRQRVLDAAWEQGALTVMAHPRWGRTFEHVSPSELSVLSGYDAVEIYNGVGRRGEGAALATDQWDRLLSDGRRVWGIATDDCHRVEDVGNAWTVVRATERSPDAILEALRHGRCYASTGVEIESIDVDGQNVRVESAGTRTIRLVSNHGAIQRSVDGRRAHFRVPEDLVHGDDHTYVRVECLGEGDAAAWTQPCWIE